jgi:hypothetical protein
MKILLLLLCIASFHLNALEYTKSIDSQKFTPGKRSKVAQETIFFPEFQFMYGLFQNYLHKWIDRPLFFDRTTRYEDGTFSYVTKKSFLKEAEIVKSYGFNGLGSLANIAGGSLYKATDQYAKENGTLPIKEVVQYGFDGNYKNLKTILKIANASPFTAKINGKIVVPTYNVFYSNIKYIKPLVDKARQEFPNKFYLMAQLDIRPKDVKEYLAKGKVSQDVLNRYKLEISNILSYFDGIQINPAINYTDVNGEYASKFDTSFYMDKILPILKEEFAKDKFKDKLLGSTILHGYINHMSGVNHGEFGTSRLRKSLEAATASNPDYVLFFEWNEVNENTCFQPTLYNSLALQRIIRYSIEQFTNAKISNNANDNLAIPNLVFSAREKLKIGEPLQLELLNIPDGTTGNYFVETILVDKNNKEIFRFPKEKFAKGNFNTITYTIGTEQLSKHYLIKPILKISTLKNKFEVKNLQYIKLHPTVCTVYKSVRQPIRDLFTPQKVKFNVAKIGDNQFKFDASLTSIEELAFLEILDNEKEILSYDQNKEYDFDKNIIIAGSFSMQGGKYLNTSFKVKNSSNWQFKPWHAPNVNFAYQIKKQGNIASGNALIWCQPCNFTILLPKEDVNKAILEVTVGNYKKEFNVANLVKYKKSSALIIPQERIRLDLELFEKLPDIPKHVNKKQASISGIRRSSYKYPVFQLRAITKSGKIYRSNPVMPIVPSKKTISVNLFSETAKKVVNAPLLADLIPNLTYQFIPQVGTTLLNNFEEYFDGQLGGGFVYCEPFCSSVPYPKGKTSAPEWKKENNLNYLHFNGEHQYLNLPAESFPRGSFTLEFTIRPEKTSKPMVLFRYFDRWLGSITGYLKFDKLYVAFGDRNLKTHSFATNLRVVPNQWNQVKISYNCKKISFTLNKKSKSFPLEARALYLKPFIFGGHNKIEFGIDREMTYFKGDLKELKIKHY